MTQNFDSVAELQKHLAKTCRDRGWDKKTTEMVFVMFVEEVGELAKEIRNQNDPTKANIENFELELADVFNYLLELANRFDIDLATAYHKKSALNETRVW